jgi:two-component system uhpT operon response regulator UhpA
MNISILDSNVILSEALNRLFKENGHDVVATFSKPSDLVQQVGSLNSDILIADFAHCSPNETKLLLDECGITDKFKVIALTAETDQEHIETLLNNGVMGYISKSSSFNDLLDGVEKVGNGHQYLSADLDKSKPKEMPKLTPQEKRVLNLLTRGFSAKEIADVLKISIKTVYIHRANIVRKFGTKNLINLKTKALQSGISKA